MRSSSYDKFILKPAQCSTPTPRAVSPHLLDSWVSKQSVQTWCEVKLVQIQNYVIILLRLITIYFQRRLATQAATAHHHRFALCQMRHHLHRFVGRRRQSKNLCREISQKCFWSDLNLLKMQQHWFALTHLLRLLRSHRYLHGFFSLHGPAHGFVRRRRQS